MCAMRMHLNVGIVFEFMSIIIIIIIIHWQRALFGMIFMFVFIFSQNFNWICVPVMDLSYSCDTRDQTQETTKFRFCFWFVTKKIYSSNQFPWVLYAVHTSQSTPCYSSIFVQFWLRMILSCIHCKFMLCLLIAYSKYYIVWYDWKLHSCGRATI